MPSYRGEKDLKCRWHFGLRTLNYVMELSVTRRTDAMFEKWAIILCNWHFVFRMPRWLWVYRWVYMGKLVISFMHLTLWIENAKLCTGAFDYKAHRCNVGKNWSLFLYIRHFAFRMLSQGTRYKAHMYNIQLLHMAPVKRYSN
jgi:hypothetical protein